MASDVTPSRGPSVTPSRDVTPSRERMARLRRRKALGQTVVKGSESPDDPMDIYEQMRPFMRKNNVVWKKLYSAVIAAVTRNPRNCSPTCDAFRRISRSGASSDALSSFGLKLERHV